LKIQRRRINQNGERTPLTYSRMVSIIHPIKRDEDCSVRRLVKYYSYTSLSHCQNIPKYKPEKEVF
jgi:hypothetical protein